MKDENKTKEQLINELAKLRQKISALEASETDHMQAEEELKKSETYIDAMGDALIVLNMQRQVIRFNKAAIELLGYSQGEVPNLTFEKLFKEKEYDKHYAEMKRAVETGNVRAFETYLLKKDGKEVPVLLSGTAMKDTKGGPIGFVGVFRDITNNKRLEEELKKLVITDKLTKAYNRTKFEEIIAIEMERAKRFAHPLSMLMFDIDGFKKTNDTFGHLIGDYVLKTVANIIRNHTRKINHLIRWGGDEFVIIPVETTLEGAKVLSERLRIAIESFDFEKVGKITASFGISQYKIDDTEDSFLKRADDALFKAKKNGGNCVEANLQNSLFHR